MEAATTFLEAFKTFQFVVFCLGGAIVIYALGVWLFSKPTTLLSGLPSLAALCVALGAMLFLVTWALAYSFSQSSLEAVLLADADRLPSVTFGKAVFAAYGLWLAAFLFLVHGVVARFFVRGAGDR